MKRGGRFSRNAFTPSAEVVRLRRGALELRLALELLLERRRRAALEQALRHPDRPRRGLGVAGGDLGGPGGERVGLDHLVDESPRVRLGGAQLPVLRQPLERTRRADQPRHEPRGARVGDEPDPDERGHEARRVGRDAEVARAGEREAGAGSGAVHGRDDGLLERADPEDRPVVAAAEAVADVAGGLAELRQVLPDAEAAAGAGDDDRAHLRPLRLLQRLAEARVHGAVERVQHVRAVERDRENAAVPACLDLRHRHLPLNSGGRFSTNAVSPSFASSDANAR